jgi:hypothetical protein
MNQGGFGGGYGPPPGGGGGWGSEPGGGSGGFAPPPAGYPPGYSPDLGATGGVQPWSSTEAVSFGWERVKADPATTIGAIFIALLVGAVPGIICNVAAQAAEEPVISNIGSIVNFISGAYMAGGIMSFALKVGRGQPYAFGDVFSGGPYFLRILACELVLFLGIFFGFLLLIVPGVILSLGWSLALTALVDKNLGPIDALKESWRLTTGHKGDIFLLYLLLMLVSIAGLCACGVGLVVTYPIMYFATTYVYLRLSGQPTAPMTAR